MTTRGKPGDFTIVSCHPATVEVWTHERCVALRVFDTQRQAHVEAVLDLSHLHDLIGALTEARAGVARRHKEPKP